MQRIFGNKKALSTVVTTLIILVVSVLLAGVVTMYAINITSTRTQQEQLKLSQKAIWVYGDGTAYASLAVDNVGGRDVVLDKIAVRGVEEPWTDVHFLRINSSLSTSLNCPNLTAYWTDFPYTATLNGTFASDGDDKPLASGDTIILYMESPDSISVNDIGTTIGITVFTVNAQYYIECNVKSAEYAG